ncbi:unnamed protein product [Discula destructiva]
MSDSEVDYLQPGFDPASVTIPRLRSILVTHGVDYPSTAKKAKLVEMFNENITPQAKKILDRRARAKRSSMGITNIDNSVGYSIANSDMPPPSTSKPRGRPKRNPASAASSFKTESEEPEPEPIPSSRTLSPRKRSQRSTSRQLGYSDTDTDSHYEARRPARKASRRLEMTPQPELVQSPESEDDRHNVFSSENPFQSGSSPLPEETPTNRRRTPAFESPAKRPASSVARRRTQEPKDAGPEQSGYSNSVDVRASALSRPKTPQTPQIFEEVEASEEFTPEEQLALAQEDAARAQTAVVPHRQNKRSGGLGTPLSVLFLTLLGAYGTWYRQEKVAVGYCGVGRPAQQIIPRHVSFQEFDFETPAWAIKLTEPECEYCPAHAYCYADNSVRCEDDYILKPHPLAAGGLVPLPPTCEPDGEKVRRVKAVADKAVEELRERRAKFECGELVDENGQAPQSPAIAVDELKQTVSEQRSKKLSNKEFDDLWSSALGEIETREEIEVERKEAEEVKP